VTEQERWKRVRDLFDAALEQPVHVRDRFLASQTPGDPRMAAEVRELLASYQESDHMLTQPAIRGLEALLPASTAPPSLEQTAPTSIIRPLGSDTTGAMVGRRMGPYRLLNKIGSGGMGSVFIAARDDRQFEQRVAIKVVRPSMNTSQILQRFLQERRVLAGLEHPNIARLLDGGTSDEGLPYLVMEYVEGVPIDRYCDEHRLNVTERLRLFRIVCDAVHYAHRSLVIHRDIKPVNILVTPDGVPKLLDFGIAKLVGPQAAGEMNLTVDTAPMTPEYASPEQVRGELVTTASDVYGLGVMLYHLLTGKSPYRAERGNPAALFHAISTQDPVKPSQAVQPDAGESATREGTVDKLCRRLSGDLDVIILTALQKEPARRYASVAALSDDVAAHLGGFPVSAQPDSVTYRGRKFIRRHTAGVAMASGLAVALLAATVTSVYYANQARREKRSAEVRFEEVRELAHFVLFDFDDALRQGETAARKVLLPKALDYLNKLSTEASGHPALQREVVAGYLKMGEVQGDLYGPTAGARTHYEQALRLAETLAAQNPSSESDILLAARANAAMATMAGYQRALALLEPFTKSNPNGPPAQQQLEVSQKLGALVYGMGDAPRALAHYNRAYDIGARLMRESPTNTRAQRSMAAALQGMGEVYTHMGRVGDALPKLTEALTILERALDDNPTQPRARHDVAAASLVLGDTLTAAGRPTEALAAFRRSLSLMDELTRTDGQNRQYRRDVPVALGRLGDALLKVGTRAEAHDVTKRALDSLWPLVDTPDPHPADLQQYAWLLVTTPFDDLRSPARALPYAQQLVEATKGSNPAILDTLARAYFGTGQPAKAVETEQKALALLPPPKVGETPSPLRKDLEDNLVKFSQAVH
jgi:non-specific serine/threonine protein kinase/serine/threonine-protein kinase